MEHLTGADLIHIDQTSLSLKLGVLVSRGELAAELAFSWLDEAVVAETDTTVHEVVV